MDPELIPFQLAYSPSYPYSSRTVRAPHEYTFIPSYSCTIVIHAVSIRSGPSTLSSQRNLIAFKIRPPSLLQRRDYVGVWMCLAVCTCVLPRHANAQTSFASHSPFARGPIAALNLAPRRDGCPPLDLTVSNRFGRLRFSEERPKNRDRTG